MSTPERSAERSSRDTDAWERVPGSVGRKRAGDRREFWVVAAVFAGGLAVAVALTVVGALSAPQRFNLGPDLAKAGVQLGTATLIGAGVAYMLRRLEDRRSDERLLAEYRNTLFVALVGAYNAAKLERRAMRAHGFRQTAADRVLTQEDANCFNAHMRSLTEAQLRFEQAFREVDGPRQDWVPNAKEVAWGLHQVEQHLNDIVNEWEASDGLIRAGAHLHDVHGLPKLQEFLGEDRQQFRAEVAAPLARMQELMRPEQRRRRRS